MLSESLEGEFLFFPLSKVHIWMSYFTWAFGIWTTAVVFVSFKTYSFSGKHIDRQDCHKRAKGKAKERATLQHRTAAHY